MELIMRDTLSAMFSRHEMNMTASV